MKNYYAQLDKAIRSYENCKSFHSLSIDWINARIDRCEERHDLSEDKIKELRDRVKTIIEDGRAFR